LAEQTTINIDFTDSMFSKLSQEEKDILSDYAKKYSKIKYFYENIRIDVKEKIYDFCDKDNIPLPQNSLPFLKREEEVEIRYNQLQNQEKFIRIDTLFLYIDSDNPDVQYKNKQHYISRYISIITPQKLLELEKKDNKNPYYSIVTRRKNNNEGQRPMMQFDTAPFAETGIPLEKMFFQKPPFRQKEKYVIDYVKPVLDSGNQCIEIKSSLADSDAYWIFKLSRDHFWGVKETHEHAANFWHKTYCTYDGHKDGIPLLKSYRIDYGRYDLDAAKTEQLTSQIQYEITNIIPGPVDLSEFDVAQFLPPQAKIGEITPARFSWFRIVCISLGILLMILGILMKQKKT
jgi:hypothetical protein